MFSTDCGRSRNTEPCLLDAGTAGFHARRIVVAGNETLGRNQRARFAPFEQLMAEAIAEDLHAGPDDIRPRMVAAALATAFSAIHDHDPATSPELVTPGQAMAVIDEVMGFLRGGLEALGHD